MTNPIPVGSEHQYFQGRSVRDVAEYDPGAVDEVWCRRILRHILQSLELQYAMHMPHRSITPDTIVFHDNGEPLLIADDIDPSPAHEADDLTALARVIHYAITCELAPTGPLQGRVAGYSASLLAAVDASMAADPAQRPQTIAAMRELLGIVTVGPAAAPSPAMQARAVVGEPVPTDAATPAIPAIPTALAAERVVQPASAPYARPVTPAAAATTVAAASIVPEIKPPLPPAPPPGPLSVPLTPSVTGAVHGHANSALEGSMAYKGGLTRWQRRAIAAGGVVALLAVALLLFAELRDSGSYDHIVLTLPQTGDARPAAPVDAGSAAPAAASAPAPVQAPGGESASGASAAGATIAAGGFDPAVASAAAPATAPAVTPGATPAPATPAPANAAPATAAPSAPVLVTTAAPSGARGAGAAAPNATPAATSAPGAAATPAQAGGNAVYQLQIKPWGVVYVDGVDRGVSPPVKRLVLTPGRHTIRISNPNFRDSVLEFDSAQTTSLGKISVDFNHDAN